jgi:hypothetical protein
VHTSTIVPFSGVNGSESWAYYEAYEAKSLDIGSSLGGEEIWFDAYGLIVDSAAYRCRFTSTFRGVSMTSTSYTQPTSLTRIGCTTPVWGSTYPADATVIVSIDHVHDDAVNADQVVAAVPTNNPPSDFEFFVVIDDFTHTDHYGAYGGDIVTFIGGGFNSYDGYNYYCMFYGVDDQGRERSLASKAQLTTSTSVIMVYMFMFFFLFFAQFVFNY